MPGTQIKRTNVWVSGLIHTTLKSGRDQTRLGASLVALNRDNLLDLGLSHLVSLSTLGRAWVKKHFLCRSSLEMTCPVSLFPTISSTDGRKPSEYRPSSENRRKYVSYLPSNCMSPVLGEIIVYVKEGQLNTSAKYPPPPLFFPWICQISSQPDSQFRKTRADNQTISYHDTTLSPRGLKSTNKTCVTRF